MAKRSVRLQVVNVTDSLEPCAALIGEAFASATATAEELLALDRVDVVAFDAPDETIPEWGVGGTTITSHLVMLAVDPTAPTLDRRVIESTLLHEYHHAVRGRSTSLDADLGSMLVAEGLATLFEEQATGSVPFYASGRALATDIDLVRASIGSAQVDRGRWFFGRGDLPSHFGYSFGYRLCRMYAQERHSTAADLVGIEAVEILATLEHVLYRDGELRPGI